MELARDFSIGISIEPISACNLDCMFCGCSALQDGSRIDAGRILSALNDIEQSRYPIEKIVYTGLGEPLLYDDLPTITTALKKRVNINHIAIFTNGLLLTPDRAEALIRAGVSHFLISLTGLTVDVFSMFQGGNQAHGRAGILLNTIQHNVQKLCEARDRFNNKIYVGINYILTEDSRTEFFQCLDYYRQIGVDWIQTMILRGSDHYYGRLEESGIPYKMPVLPLKDTEEVSITDSRYITRLTEHVKEMKGWLCSIVGLSMQITSTGEVYACCERHDETLLGNIHDADLVDLINSDKLEKLVESLHRTYDQIPQCCATCVTARSLLASAYKDRFTM